jgi:hypothetical protein
MQTMAPLGGDFQDLDRRATGFARCELKIDFGCVISFGFGDETI